jgi:hypothetical protein
LKRANKPPERRGAFFLLDVFEVVVLLACFVALPLLGSLPAAGLLPPDPARACRAITRSLCGGTLPPCATTEEAREREEREVNVERRSGRCDKIHKSSDLLGAARFDHNFLRKAVKREEARAQTHTGKSHNSWFLRDVWVGNAAGLCRRVKVTSVDG